MAPNPQSSSIYSRVGHAVKTDEPHLHKLIQQMASYHGYAKCDFDPVYKTLHLDSAITDPESETYKSEEDVNVVVGGYILFYPSYSGYFEKPSIFLEHLYVRECYMEFGLGKMLFSAMAGKAKTLGFSSVDWLVKGSNVKAIEFYLGMGGQIMQDVKQFRLSGEGLEAYS